MTQTKWSMILAFMGVLVSPAAYADGAIYIPVQGVLTDADGARLQEGVTARFGMVDGDGDEVWSETFFLAVENGLFSAMLGHEQDIDPAFFSDSDDISLTMRVNSDDLGTWALGSVPYAAHAVTADNAAALDGHAAADFAAADHSHDFNAGTGLAVDDDGQVSVDQGTVQGWINDSAYNNEEELEAALDDRYFQAPGNCGNEQVMKWNGQAWGCADDVSEGQRSDDAVENLARGVCYDTPEELEAQLNLDTRFVHSPQQSCDADQILKWNGQSWGCAADEDANTQLARETVEDHARGVCYDTPEELQGVLDARYFQAPANCNNGQVLKWDANALAWGCGEDGGNVYGAGDGLSLGQNGDFYVTAGGINQGHLATGSVHSLEIADNAVGSGEIATNAVGSDEIAAGAIGQSEMGADAVGHEQMQNGAIGTDELQADAVTTAKIADNAVGSDQLAANACLEVNIADGAVTAAKIAAGAIGQSEMGADAVGSAQMQNGAIGTAELQADAVTGAKIADGAVGSEHLAANACIEEKIADNAVTAAKIAAGAIGQSEMGVDAVGLAQMQNDSVGADELRSNSVTSSEIATNAVNAAEISTNAVGHLEIATDAVRSGEIKDGEVKAADLAANACTEAKIASDAVTAAKIKSNAVLSAEIKDGEVKTADLASDAVTAAKIADDAVGNDQLADDIDPNKLGYQRVIYVPATGTDADNGNLLRVTVNNANSTLENPVIIRLAPGKYDLGSDYFNMDIGMTIEGAGQRLTRVWSGRPGSYVIKGNTYATLRGLDIRNDNVAGVNSDSMTIFNSSTGDKWVGGLFTIDNCFIYTYNSNQNDPRHTYGIKNGGNMVVRDSQVYINTGGTSNRTGIRTYGDGMEAYIYNTMVRIQESNANGGVNHQGYKYGIYASGGAYVEVHNSRVGMDDLGGEGKGLYSHGAGSWLHVFGSSIYGKDYSAYESTSGNISIFGSRISNNEGSGVKCAGCRDWENDSLDGNCDQ